MATAVSNPFRIQVVAAGQQTILQQIANTMNPGDWVGPTQWTALGHALPNSAQSLDALRSTGSSGTILTYFGKFGYHPGTKRIATLAEDHHLPLRFALYDETTNSWTRRGGYGTPMTEIGDVGRPHQWDGTAALAYGDHIYQGKGPGGTPVRILRVPITGATPNDVINNTWEFWLTISSWATSGTMATEHFVARGKFYGVHSLRIIEIDPAANGGAGSSSLVTTHTLGGDEPFATYNPVSQKMLYGGGTAPVGSRFVFRMDVNRNIEAIANQPPVAIGSAQSGVACCIPNYATGGWTIIQNPSLSVALGGTPNQPSVWWDLAASGHDWVQRVDTPLGYMPPLPSESGITGHGWCGLHQYGVILVVRCVGTSYFQMWLWKPS